jgi:hypothetical protein
VPLAIAIPLLKLRECGLGVPPPLLAYLAPALCPAQLPLHTLLPLYFLTLGRAIS